jgi:Cu/Ag efflux protein CusF
MITRTVLALALCLAAADASAGQKEFRASRTESVTAKVEKVDQKTREVTLVAEDGSKVSFKASEEVKNLKQLKKGDTISATMDQSLTLWILEKDQLAPELSVGADVYRAQPGQKPAGMMTADLSGVAEVVAIAADKSTVSLKGPKGNVVELAVRDPANLEGVVVGTRVGFAYSETLAIAVAGKGEKKK